MPSQITHVLAGLLARKRAGLILEPRSVPLFNMGCQGPDIFAHNRRTKPFALAYARLLHRRRYGAFCRVAAQQLIENPDSDARAWLSGFVTHQAVDRAVHPYIVFRSDQLPPGVISGVSPALYHAFFERIIDVLLLRQLSGRPVSRFNMDPLFRMDRDAIHALSRFIAVPLRLVYPENTEGDDQLEIRIGNAFRDTRYFYHMTNPVRTSMIISADHSAISRFSERGPAGVALLYPEDPDPAVDWLNDKHTIWKDPVQGGEHTESVLDLVLQAVETARRAIVCLESVLAGKQAPDALEECVGNECLSIQKEDGSIASVVYADPFDLPSELLRKTDLRRRWIVAGSAVDRVKGELV